MHPKVTLVTMSQGNPKAMLATLQNTANFIDEIIFGDLIIFDQDRQQIESYKEQFNLKTVKYPFNYIFNFGFSSILNSLASHASNDLVLYLNVSEAVDGEHRILQLLEKFDQFNCYAFNHATDPHTWVRLFHRQQLQWSGVIHEQIVGPMNVAPFYLFQMKDLEKDLDDPFKAKVMNDVKELVYFNQYIKLVETPELLGASNEGWLQFAKDNYDSMRHRLFEKRERYEAFKEGNLEKYLNDVFTNPIFEQERFESSLLIEYQGDKKYLI